jgi:O-antigen/teichoic acid export membrane protein
LTIDAAAPGSISSDSGEPELGGPTTRRRTLNFLFLAAGEALAKLLTFAAFVHLGRTLGPELYGRVEFVLAVMVFFALSTDFGLGNYGAREIAKDPRRAATLPGEIAGLRLLLAFGACAGVLLLSAVLPLSGDVRTLLAFYGLSLFAFPALLPWLFQGLDLMHWVALASVARQAVFAGLVLLFVGPRTPLAAIGLCEIAAAAAAAIFFTAVARQRLQLPFPRPRLRLATLTPHLRRAAPIGLGLLAWAALWYVATILLGVMVGGESLGWFGASHRAVLALHTFVYLYFFNLLPSLSRTASQPRESLLRLVRDSLPPAVWVSLLVALLTAVLSRELLTLAYGSEFAGGARVLSLLVWIIPLTALGGYFHFTLVAYDLQNLDLIALLAGGMVALVAGLALIPAYGALGAAAALLIAAVLQIALAYLFVRRRIVRIEFADVLVAPLMATAAAFVLHTAVRDLGPWAAAALSALLYLAILAVWGVRQSAHPRLLRTLPWSALG